MLVAAAAGIASGQKILIEPRFFLGQTLYYRVVLRSALKSIISAPIVNPEGGSEFKQSVSMIVRLDVLSLPAVESQSPARPTPGSPANAGAAGMRLRATFEKVEAANESDAVDPGAPSSAESYKALAGHSIEFTVGPDGRPTDFAGLEEIHLNSQSASGLFTWLDGLVSISTLPKHSISVGEKWSDERTLSGMPLTGLIWRTDSSYLRDEPCDASSAASSPPAGSHSSQPAASSVNPGPCAVILTRFEITRKGSPHDDATPEDYIQNGLRTMGKWTGSGESIDSISIASGMLVSSTQSSTQDTDYTITSATSGSKIHQQGHMTTETEITLWPSAAPQS